MHGRRITIGLITYLLNATLQELRREGRNDDGTRV